MPGKFVVKKGTTGKFRFSLLSTNGQVVATSEAYNSKAACLNGVKSVRGLAGDAEVEDQTTRQWAADEGTRKAAAAEKAAKKRATKKATTKRAAAARKAPARRAPAKRAPAARRTPAKKAASRSG